MSIDLSIYTVLCSLSAISLAIMFFNQYVLKTQMTVAITLGAALSSLIIIVVGQYVSIDFTKEASHLIVKVNFRDLLLQGMLGFLLFSGALNIHLNGFIQQKIEITLLALISTLLSTILVAAGMFGLCQFFGINIAFIYCLVFGALISPTDPIAVLAIIKKLKAPNEISTKIEGESLFNDGVGLVVFLSLFSVAFEGKPFSMSIIAKEFITEAVGGIIFGLLLGLLLDWLIRHARSSDVQFLITLQAPLGGFALANTLGLSGALAMVVCGLVIGNKSRKHSFNKEGMVHIDHFWKQIEDIINSVLFLLIGFIVITISIDKTTLILSLAAIPIVLLGRWIAVKTPFVILRQFRRYNSFTEIILTWGGLRGGLSLAMAMVIPHGISLVTSSGTIDLHEITLLATYCVVIFSILIQAPTIPRLIVKANKEQTHQIDELK